MTGGAGRRATGGLALLAVLVACSSGGKPATAPAARSDPEGTVRVFAASSLTDGFRAMAEPFEDAHRDLHVTFSFAASSAIVQQVAAGAPADVVATADEVTMRALTDHGDAISPRAMARNRLTILVGKGNPLRITGLADLARPDVVVVLCAPEVPCGRLTRAALDAAGVEVEPASREENVRAVAAKVVLGEADAGIVYTTDVQALGEDAESVEIDVAARPGLEAVYSIAVTREAENPSGAQAWVDFVLSDEGQGVLARMGFLPR